MLTRAVLLWLTLLAALPVEALARAGGGTHSFHSPSSGGGRSRGFGHGYGGGHHFFFFGGGGAGGGLLLIVLVIVALILLSRSRRR